ncbi:hypothetical protein FHY30_001850 [Xanthomonas arboricola]|uniref:hypothetical protein n=1 Tax=Xanthomonas campestris TaxID=339 RepID=UPI000E1EB354|nr:hypothetical protein [Xanthomonas campestris]MCW2003095.1 hypothetical protein [Xanthomonas campestris]
MMMVAPRFIAVDDKKEHLEAIVSSLQRIGAPCVGVQYDVQNDLDISHFRGVRCLFMDLHLSGGNLKTDHKGDYGRIQQILEDCINPRGGPFILVMWTQHPHLKDELIAYLEKNIHEDRPYARPLAVLSLAKDKYLADLDNGVVGDSQALLTAIEESILGNPQLAVLLQWEADVLRAAGATLASLLELVPISSRTNAHYSDALDSLLSRLVIETVGTNHVSGDPRAAITTALAPILSDRVQNQDVTAAETATWGAAVTKHTTKMPKADPIEAGSINRMLHLAIPGTEKLSATDWGAVVPWPFEWNDGTLANLTGLNIKDMLCQQFKMRSASMGRCCPVLVRVGAACDYAQANPGPITYLFGLEIPEDAERQDVKIPDAIWVSPVFFRDATKGPYRIRAHIRFPQTHLSTTANAWPVTSRLREQLLMHLINAASTYVARPGIVQIPG